MSKAKYIRPQELVGGCDSNPGCHSSGEYMTFTEINAKTGRYRRTTVSICNPYYRKVEFRAADRASLDYIAERSRDEEAEDAYQADTVARAAQDVETTRVYMSRR